MADEFVQGPPPKNVTPVASSDEFVQGPPPKGVSAVSEFVQGSPSPNGWTKSDYGFNTRPTTDHLGRPTVQRDVDNGVWYPDKKDQAKGKWFDNEGQQLPDTPGGKLGTVATAANTMMGLATKPVKTLGKLVANTSILPGSNPLTNPTPQITLPGGMKASVAPTLGGIAKGAIEGVPAAAQFAEHAVPKALNYVDTQLRKTPLARYMGEQNPIVDTSGPGTQITEAIQSGAKDLGINDPVGEFIGQALPFVATGGSSSVAAPSKVSSLVKMLEPVLSPSTLSKLGKTAQVGTNIVKNAAIGGVLAPVLTPETNVQNEEDYWNRKQGEAVTGAVAGGVLTGAIEAAPYIPKATKWIDRKAFGGKDIILPEILKDNSVFRSTTEAGETIPAKIQNPVDHVFSALDNGEYPALTNLPLDEIRIKAGSNVGSESAQARSFMTRYNNALSNKYKVPMSVADMTGDPVLRQQYNNLSKDRISNKMLNAHNLEQGQALSKVVDDHLSDLYGEGIVNPETSAQQTMIRKAVEDSIGPNGQVDISKFGTKMSKGIDRLNKSNPDLDLTQIKEISDLIKATPNAGRVINANGVIEDIVGSLPKLFTKSGLGVAGHAVGGPVVTIVAPIVEYGAEAAASKIRAGRMIKPESLGKWVDPKLTGFKDPWGNIPIEPPTKPKIKKNPIPHSLVGSMLK